MVGISFAFLCLKAWSDHRQREIDCSSAIVGRLAAGAESGGKSIHWPACDAKMCFKAAATAGNITTTVNKVRQAEPMSSLLLLGVYGSNMLRFRNGNKQNNKPNICTYQHNFLCTHDIISTLEKF